MPMRKPLVRTATALALCWALAPLGWANVPAKGAAPASTTAATCPPQATPMTADDLRAANRSAQDRGLLWQISKDGRTSWLYGTVHLARRDWVVPGPTVMRALQQADQLALELNLLDPAVFDVLMAGMRADPAAQPLPAALQARVTAQADSACAGPEMTKLRPEMQVFALLAQSARREGLDPAYGIDMVLAGMAQGLRKPVISLEDPATQLRVLLSDEPAKVQETVEAGLRQLEDGTAAPMLNTLASVWADGRLNLLDTYPQWCDCLKTDAERADYARAVDGRNPAMARAIAAAHTQGRTVFAAVGALHMVGPQALPTLLRAQGFVVQRVSWGIKEK